MNVSILQENLLRALIKAGRVVSPKAQLPIMQTVLLSAKGSSFSVSAASLEITEVASARAKVEEEGGICVSSRLFTELVTSLPQETVYLIVKEGSLHVRCGGVSATIPGMSASEFPPINVVERESGILFDKDHFLAVFTGVLFAAATDEGRPLLTGVKISMQGGDVTVVATDGYRLSRKVLSLGGEKTIDAVIPARALSEVVKVCSEEKEVSSVVMVQSADGQLGFIVGDSEIHTRVISGEYPAIEKIIPKTHNTRLLVDAQTLIRAVKSAAVFAKDSANILRFHIENQTLVVLANTPQVGENRVEIEAKVDGDGGDIAFNSRFLIEFLNNFTGDEVLFEMTGSLNPGVFRSQKDESYLHIIMPVRVAA